MQLRWVVMVAAALSATACTTAVQGRPVPAHHTAITTSPPWPQPPPLPSAPVIDEDPARWAEAHVDPCKLFAGLPLDIALAHGPTPDKYGRCEVSVRMPDGARPMFVEVGTDFDHANRSTAVPVTVGGLTAYQLWSPGSERCDVSLPLSATRAITVLTVMSGDGPDAGCAMARTGAEAVAARLRNDPAALLRDDRPAPPRPPTSPLGIPAGQPDEPTARECQVVIHATVDSCHAPLPVDVPHGAASIMRVPAEWAADVSCAMLAPSLRRVSGQDVVVATFGTNCVGATVDGTLEASLGFFPFARLDDYCSWGVVEHTPTTLAGHPGTVCGDTASSRHLIMSAYRDPEVKGVLLVDLDLSHPRGVLDHPPPQDAASLELADRIAESVLAGHFG